MISPLTANVVFYIGPVPIAESVIVTWVLMAILIVGAVLLSRNLTVLPSSKQAAVEVMVTVIDAQIRDTTGVNPAPYRAFIGTLFLFILMANWSSLIPGVTPPTAALETDAALAVLVFLSVIWFGVRGAGVWGYLRSFAVPNPVMIPLNLLQNVTRSFSMFVRLFGNVMSGVFVIGIVASLAGLIVPIPLMALDLLTGLVQAYIFAILATVFIGAAVAAGQPKPTGNSRD